MPREKITGTDHDGFVVQVGWTPDHSNVQLGVETFDGKSLLTALYGSDEQLRRIGYALGEVNWQYRKPHTNAQACEVARLVLDIVQGGPDPKTKDETRPMWGHDSVWVHLNRVGSNRLIKTIRRARDSAFGRDE